LRPFAKRISLVESHPLVNKSLVIKNREDPDINSFTKTGINDRVNIVRGPDELFLPLNSGGLVHTDMTGNATNCQ
jgi:hypothetical protein